MRPEIRTVPTVPAPRRERIPAEELHERAFDHAAIGMGFMDPEGRWFRVNHALCDFLGYPESELLSMTLRDVTYPEDLDPPAPAEERGDPGLPDGEALPAQGRERGLGLAEPLAGARRPGRPPFLRLPYTGHLREQGAGVSARLPSVPRPLTGLPNRAALTGQLQRSLASAERHESSVALLFVDLDGFKRVNGTLGHEAGDELLAAVARRLKTCVRAGDTMVRLGGDEFCLLLEDAAGTEDAVRLSERVKKCLEEPFNVGDHYVPPITVSVGIAVQVPGTAGPPGGCCARRISPRTGRKAAPGPATGRTSRRPAAF